MLTIAIVGRPNVGKTTLFNRLSKKNLSIAHNTPGVTRDRKYSVAEFKGRRLRFIDTAGLEKAPIHGSLARKTLDQSISAIDESDLCCLVIDGLVGMTDEDEFFAKLIQKKGKAIVALINKTESEKRVLEDFGVYKINPQGVFRISAEHRIGIDNVLEFITLKYGNIDAEETQNDDSEVDVPEDDGSFSLAFVGMPNAGKSSIINNILKEERLVTDSVAGTTRDAISIPIDHSGQKINIIDTAGIRKKANIENPIEEMSVTESFKAIDFAHVVAIVIDAEKGLCHQDKALIGKTLEEGRALMLVVNKWDLIQPNSRKDIVESIKDAISKTQTKSYLSDIFTVSALKDKSLNPILDRSVELYNRWKSRIPTKKLNNWLREKLLPSRQTPRINGKRVLKLKFISQTSIRPPSFTISSNFTDIPQDYINFIRNGIMREFDLGGIPVRITFKKASNPFSRTRKTSKKYKI